MEPFEKLTQFLDSLQDRFDVPGCDCAVSKDNQIIYRHSSGFSDTARSRPVSPQDTYWIYSATKLFTCTAAMQLIEQGKLDLNAPVSRYLPEFSNLHVSCPDGSVQPAKNPLLIRHLMTMTGGLDYDLFRPALAIARQDPLASTRTIVSALSKDPLQFEPGSHYLYSLCHDVLGAVIETITGQTLASYLDNAIIIPLEMRNTTFHPTDEQLSRHVTQYIRQEDTGRCIITEQDNQFQLSECYDSGGAGLLSSVDDYMRLISTLSCGGLAANGYQLLNTDTIQLMASDHLGPQQRKDFLFHSPIADRGYSYGLGVRVLVEPDGTGMPLGCFGWDGAAGAYALVDPQNHIAMYYAQQICQSPLTFQVLHPLLRSTLYSCLQE